MFSSLWALTWFLMQLAFYIAVAGLLLWIDYCIIRIVLKCFGLNLPKHPIKYLKDKNKEKEETKETEVKN